MTDNQESKARHTAILFQVHSWTPFVRWNFTKLLKEVQNERYEIWLLSEKVQDMVGLDCSTKCRQFNFCYQNLFLKVYGRIPNTTHRYRWGAPFHKYYGQLLPILAFCDLHPEYSQVWRIEYDSYFHGSAETFFDFWRTDESDLICSHISTNLERWVHRDLFVAPSTFQQNLKTKCLTVVMRLSHHAARLILQHLSNYLGHHELVLPTLVRTLGCTISDFGAINQFTPDKSWNKFYLSGHLSTIRVKKPWKFSEIWHHSNGTLNNMWYHPVKTL